MRLFLTLGLVPMLALAGCAGGPSVPNDGTHAEVCQEQHDMALNGKVPSGEISISCPAHGIGYAYQ